MKARVYLRAAQTIKGVRFEAGMKPNYRPLMIRDKPLPTAMFALDLDLPDELFLQAEQVLAEVVVAPEDVQIAAEVVEPDA